MKIFCKAPFTGPTIDPMGNITLCCASKDRDYLGAKINEVDSLQDFFKGEVYEQIRNKVALEGVAALGDQCRDCIAAKTGNPTAYTALDSYKTLDIDPNLNITHLEITTSNVCNQTCATCSSYFSSKWRKIHKQFHNHLPSDTYQMAESAINAVIETVPSLQYLCMKGGEPTADQNNVKILEEVVKINPNLEINIVTNFQTLSDQWWEFFKYLPNMRITASIDATGLLYNWIRGGDYEETHSNIVRYIETANGHLLINPVASIYNIFNLQELFSAYHGWTYTSKFNNIVIHPGYSSAFMIEPDKLAEIFKTEYQTIDQPFIPSNLSNREIIKNSWYSSLGGYITQVPKAIQFIENMDRYRGIKLFDIEPKLEKVFDDLFKTYKKLEPELQQSLQQ